MTKILQNRRKPEPNKINLLEFADQVGRHKVSRRSPSDGHQGCENVGAL